MALFRVWFDHLNSQASQLVRISITGITSSIGHENKMLPALRVSIYAELSCKLRHLTLHLLSQTQFDDVTELSFRRSKVFCMKISHGTVLNPTPTLLSSFLVFGSNISLKVSIPFLNTRNMTHSATSCHIVSLWKKSSPPSIPWRMHRGCKSRITERSSNLFQMEGIMVSKGYGMRLK